MARHQRRQLQSSETVARKPSLPPATPPPPKQQSQRRAVWPHSTCRGCSSAGSVAGAPASPAHAAPAVAACAGGMDHRRSERSSLAEASRPPQVDHRTLRGQRQVPCIGGTFRGLICPATACRCSRPSCVMKFPPFSRTGGWIPRGPSGGTAWPPLQAQGWPGQRPPRRLQPWGPPLPAWPR